MKPYLYILVLLMSAATLADGQKDYKAAIIGFYNVENLFDTIDTPDVRDTEFTPQGSKNYNTALYQDKLQKLSSVIADVGTDITPDGFAVLGVAEIENRDVLVDLTNQEALKKRRYQIIHYDSPDRRGIDVALLYQPKYFSPRHSEAITYQPIDMDGDTVITRDILYVNGLLDGEWMHVFVNHWPSRRGGAARSAPLRNGAADVVKSKIDSILIADPESKIVILGDLNDDPTSPSVKDHLQAVGSTKELKRGKRLYNPMVAYYKKGIGTGAYRDTWSLFDQVIINDRWVKDKKGYQFKSSHIYRRPYMLQKFGAFKGYPKRCFVGDNYMGGYSDHFPVYALMLKKTG